ncbi:MAG: PACE efflux transporter [Rhodobacteraceae bacterium]|nr:PACE efflux transporter [Paracoccaceae bacterium]MBR9823247.1 PACE efflux transporter [Paracoccaceae bacterium]
MRSSFDRLRHAVSFEILALLLMVPLGALAFHEPVQDIGVLGLVGATLATLWNLVYNLGFDMVLRRRTGSTLKSLPVRILHAVLFELGLLVALMPFIAWYLGVSPWRALAMDASFALFYVVYGFAFNWGYDRLFPLPEWQETPGTA